MCASTAHSGLTILLYAHCCRQRDSAQQKDALELELIALKKSTAGALGRGPPARRGSQVMFGATDGATPGSPGQPASASAAAAEAKADRLARELEEAEEEISAMTSQMKQQVNSLACVMSPSHLLCLITLMEASRPYL